MHEADEPGPMLATVIDRRVRLAGILICAVCVAYFYALDRVLFSSAHFSRIFRLLLTTQDFPSAWLALAVCLLAALWNRPAPILRLVDFAGNHPYSLAFVSGALMALGTVFVYHGYALSMDEYAAVFQAKIFASGHLSVQLPRDMIDWLVVRGFNDYFLVASAETGRAIGHYWPGFALLLAPFELLQTPWLCNASLAGLALVLIQWMTKEITGDRRAAGWALLFTLSSGVFVANAISYYSMQAHMTANLLFAALLMRPSGYRALGAGLAGSIALNLHNPVPHALFAMPWMVAIALDRDQRRYLLPAILGYLPGMVIFLGWLAFRADIASGVHGVSAARGITEGVFAWPDATMLNMRLAALVKMGIWTLPCVFVFAAMGRRRHGDNRCVRLLTQSAVLTFVGYLFVRFDQGHGWGYRYFHSAWGAVPILAGCAMTSRSGRQERHRGLVEGHRGLVEGHRGLVEGHRVLVEQYGGLVSFAGAAALLSLVLVLPFQMHQINEFICHHLAQLPPPQNPGNNVYFIHPSGGFYTADMVQIDPLLRDRDLLLVSRGAELDAALVRQNWPDAVEIGSGPVAQQWYLGPQDRRVPIPGSKDQKHFVFCLSPCPPSAADR
jgi:hypothetical protein